MKTLILLGGFWWLLGYCSILVFAASDGEPITWKQHLTYLALGFVGPGPLVTAAWEIVSGEQN